MKVVGMCTECRRIKLVRASGHQLATAKGNVVSGICDACQVAEDDKHRMEQERRRRR